MYRSERYLTNHCGPSMSEASRDGPVGTAQRTDRPVVGVNAAGASPDAVAAAILRSRRAGLDVLVGVGEQTSPDVVAFAEELGAPIVRSTVGRGIGTSMRDRLGVAARQVGYPGLCYQEEAGTRVDFDATVGRLEGTTDYLVDVVPQPRVDPAAGVLVGIPAYNEGRGIAAVVEEARQHAESVLVVDDGSDDGTAERAREAGATVIQHETNRGYGAALQTIFEEATRAGARHLVVLDGDGQHDPADIPTLLDTTRAEGVDLVIGSRFEAGSETELPVYRRIGIHMVNLLTNLSMGLVRPRARLSDTQSGFRAYSRRAVESLAHADDLGQGMGASTDILHHALTNDFAMTEVGTTVDYSVDDANNQNAIAHGMHLTMNLIRTIEEQRPISLLGVPGFLSTVVGIGFAYLTLSNYISTGGFPLGLALVSVFFTLAGIFACFTAIILHSLKQHFGGRGRP